MGQNIALELGLGPPFGSSASTLQSPSLYAVGVANFGTIGDGEINHLRALGGCDMKCN